MRNLGYILLKYWVKIGLHLYYGKIVVLGLDTVPKDKPILFLPNHQSALLDVLLIGVDCGRKPYFLTRSDVFKRPMLERFFTYLQMIPIYRIRDGRNALKNNEAVFAKCAALLGKNQAILMFPEANHNIKRRVRPLSKGFTRILFSALDKNPDLDIQMIPVGLNYRTNSGFPDQVAIYFGKCIPVLPLYDKADPLGSANKVKEAVAINLKGLTTHIRNEEDHDKIEKQLNGLGVDYLAPSKVNEAIDKMGELEVLTPIKPVINGINPLFKAVFILLNLPMTVLWWGWMKPKVWEPEFTGTLRFAFALLGMPLYYMFVFITISFAFTWPVGLAAITTLFIYNWMYVKLG